MMRSLWSLVRQCARWLGDVARTCFLWFEGFEVVALAPLGVTLVPLLEAMALGLRRRMGVWW